MSKLEEKVNEILGIEKEVEKIADAHDKIEAIKTYCT